MHRSLLGLTTGAAIVLGVAFCASNVANAQSVMKLCGEQWKAAKAAGTTNGETWPQFLAQCRTQQTGGGAAPAAPAYAPALQRLPDLRPSAGRRRGMTTRQCDAEYEANKAAIRASGQTKRAFVAACRSGNARIPQRTAAAPPPSYQPPAPVPAPAPTTGSLVPSSHPAAPPTEPPYSSLPTPMGNGEFASDQQAHSHCPSRHCRLGQHALSRLSFRRNSKLRAHERGRLHVRGGREGRWRPRCDE